MKRLIFALLALCSPALADYHPPIEYGVAATVDFVLYNTDGTLDVDEADGGTEVTIHCDGDAGTTATNDFADEGSYYSIALTASETQCARVTLDIAATDRNVVIIPTFGNASAQVDYVPANAVQIEGGDATNALDTAADTVTVTSMGSGTLTAAAIATDAITAAKIAANAIGASELATDAIGSDELAATALAEINAEADTALSDYDPPTRAELTSDINGLNDLSAAQVNAEVDSAIETYHLDHLLAVNYDPASKPGTATALFNELIENDGGVSRYTANALEQAPTGGSAPSAAAIADAVWDEVASGHTTAGTFGDALGVDVPAILVDTAAIPSFPTNFDDLDIEATTGHVDVGFWNGTAISTALETASDIVDEWETQSQADPTGFRVNVLEVEGTDATDALDTAADTVGVTSMGVGTITAGVVAADAIGASELAESAVNEIRDRPLAVDLSCEVNTANFAGSATTLACILTDRDGGAVTQASGDLEGKLLEVTSGAQIREVRYIRDTTWDGANSELQLTLSRALPATLADAVTANIR